MQSADGGWAAFDVDNNWEFLSDVPFADHNAMLDPTCPDITGRVLEALCAFGVKNDHPAIKKAIDYLIRTQGDDGSWYGRWGVNYVYGTFLALRGFQAAGEDDREAHVLRGRGMACARFRMPMAAGARVAPVTITAFSRPHRARHRRQPGRFWVS